MQVFVNRLPKFRPATRAIEILYSQNERAVARAAALLRAPKSDRVAGVQVAGRRWRKAAAIRELGLQIADFSLPEPLFNLKSSILKSSNSQTAAPFRHRRNADQLRRRRHPVAQGMSGRTNSGSTISMAWKSRARPTPASSTRFCASKISSLTKEHGPFSRPISRIPGG